jgi:hypothetical protein
MSVKRCEGYVDGSFCCGVGGVVRIGAGVYFGESDPLNRSVPVPFPPPPPKKGVSVDSLKQNINALRAELYASLLFIYLVFHEKRVDFHTVVTLYQDSLIAVHLLNLCRFGSIPELQNCLPSVWANKGSGIVENHVTKEKSSLYIRYDWGEIVTPQTIIEYADILDLWWLHTKNRFRVQVMWMQAHQKEPVANTLEHHRWLGNNVADALAKLGAKTPRDDPELLSLFSHYPLYRNDPTLVLPPKPNPLIHLLPLYYNNQEKIHVTNSNQNSVNMIKMIKTNRENGWCTYDVVDSMAVQDECMFQST